MNAITFIKKHGIEKAREVVDGAPSFPVFGYCALTGSYIFKRKYTTAYYHNETNSWSEDYAIELILLDDLKRLVESVDIIDRWKGIQNCKDIISAGTSTRQPPVQSFASRMIKAIADYEAIYKCSYCNGFGEVGCQFEGTFTCPDCKGDRYVGGEHV
ncbi:YuiA family protein [Acinetobacter sp. NIPH 1852]|uniref:YuiA family protein n=1 Tax=Acinetobacter sp. NIPH 1852 TaxID=2923428 RepID=UPI001F4A69AA|nr:YuiA family protein [Acinetobacter sp. NIPH 1852]MCH7307812.1 YuiA family protein [Acinetobacter sp. NIPH 1852]